VALIFGIIYLVFFSFLLLEIYFIPPHDIYEPVVRAGIFIVFLFFILFFLYPLSVISSVLSVVFGNLGYKFLLYRNDSLSS